MNNPIRSFASINVLLAAAIFGCSSSSGTGEDTGTTRSQREHGRVGEGREHGESTRSKHDGKRGEHDRDGGEHRGDEGEESGTELKLTENYDAVRNGARLILAYEPTSNSFKGTVENTTTETLEWVRVEVHLSNGKELGPTTPSDLEPGEKKDVELKAASQDFDGWTAHSEVGSSEHGHSGEHVEESREEHDRDGNEHGGESGEHQ